jgi:DNA-binding CsgD family transcriptional regulator
MPGGVVGATPAIPATRAIHAMRATVLSGGNHMTVTLKRRLGNADPEALSEALDCVWLAVAMISRCGRVVYANHAAALILQRGVGLSMSQDARLRATTHDARALLSRALQAMQPASLAVQRLDQPPLILRLQPLSADHNGTLAAAALLFISDPASKPDDCSDALRTCYGLTKTEARVVQSISEGVPLKKIANAHQVTYETARTYVRRILSKTGAKRQAELVRITHSLR